MYVRLRVVPWQQGRVKTISLFGRVVIRAEPEALNKVTQYRLSFTYVATLLAAS